MNVYAGLNETVVTENSYREMINIDIRFSSLTALKIERLLTAAHN